MKSGRGWKDVLEVLGTWFLETMKWGVGKILGQTLIIQAVPRQCHRLVLGQCHPDDLPVHLLSIQVAHSFSGGKRNISRMNAMYQRIPKFLHSYAILTQ